LAALATLALILTISLQSSPGTAALRSIRGSLLAPPVPALTRFAAEDSLTVTPASVVAALKSSEAQAEDITFTEITSMVNEAIQRAGGFDGLIADGDTVVLKPNLIASQDFSASADTLNPEVNGIATDYRVIQATVNAVRSVNPNGAVFLLEGSGVGSTSENMAILRWDEVTGLDSLIYLEEACGDWYDTTSVYLEGVSLPEGKALYTPAGNRYWLNKLYYDADVLISLPVLKNHLCTGITGAVKNVGIGATPPTIYGCGPDVPYRYERWCRINHGANFSARIALHNWIHDFYMCRPVDFVIMDGLQGIENGPLVHEWLNGTQHISEDQMNARLILASRDPIAMDAIASLLCGHDPALIRHLVKLHNDSLGCSDARLLRVDGIKVGDEKQDYEINDSGLQSKYTDFTPPSFAVQACYVLGNQLHLQLTVDGEVNKVEVAVDGVYLDQIQLGEFDDFFFDLGAVEVNENTEIIVYAYDQYLNYSSETVSNGTGVEPGSEVQTRLRVWPTPTRARTTITYALNRPGAVTLSIYNVAGRKVETLVEGERPEGTHQVVWNSSRMAAGVYLIRLETEEGTFLGKAVKAD
jgi:uncharacterized protein (DUF362 family)